MNVQEINIKFLHIHKKCSYKLYKTCKVQTKNGLKHDFCMLTHVQTIGTKSIQIVNSNGLCMFFLHYIVHPTMRHDLFLEL